MEEREEKKGFTIRDRRISSQKEEPGERESGKPEGAGEGEVGDKSSPPPLPDVDFSSFIFSLSTSALLHLGEVPDPVSQKRGKNLPLAKQTIDILAILREKTRGNLTSAEEQLMDHLLTDLRWRYVREVKE